MIADSTSPPAGQSPHRILSTLACVWACLSLAIDSESCFAQTAETRAEKLTSPPVPVAAEVLEGLVKKLSSPEFQTREEANDKLASLVSVADLPTLQTILKDQTDLECQVRLSGVISKIREERLQTQIRLFMRSNDPSDNFGFGGWVSFSRYSGGNRNAKMLFLKLLELYPELVEKEVDKNEAIVKAKSIANYITEKMFVLQSQDIAVADVLALLYCVNAADELYTTDFEAMCQRYFSTSPFSGFLGDAQSRKPLEQLLLRWALKTKEMRAGSLQLLIDKEFPAARELALDTLNSPTLVEKDFAFLLSMHALYKFGTVTDVELAERWLEDKTVCHERQMYLVPPAALGNGEQPGGDLFMMTVERRDISLLVAMKLAGADATEAFPRLQNHFLRGFVIDSISERENNDKAREAKIQKWRSLKKNG